MKLCRIPLKITRTHFAGMNGIQCLSDFYKYSRFLFDVNFHINAEKMKNRRDYSRDFSPGHYNLSASMKLTHLDNFRLTKYC